MIGPQLQKAIYDALRAAPALADGRTYDRVPPEAERIQKTGAAYPFIEIGTEQVLDDGNTCSEGWEVYPDVDVWSRSVGKVEAKTLGAAVVARVLAITAVDGFNLIGVYLESYNVIDDPDPLTGHVAMTFRVLLDPA